MTFDSVFERITSIPLVAFATKRLGGPFAARVRLLHRTKETPPEHPTTTASSDSVSDRDASVVDPLGDAWTGDSSGKPGRKSTTSRAFSATIENERSRPSDPFTHTAIHHEIHEGVSVTELMRETGELTNDTEAPGIGTVTQHGTRVVLDTSVLIADPNSLAAYPGCAIVIPLTVIEELDGLKSRPDDVGRAARAALRSLEELRTRAGGSLAHPVPLSSAPDSATVHIEINGIQKHLLNEHGLDAAKPDNRIIGAALGQATHAPKIGRAHV